MALTKKDLEKIDGLVLVYLTADWCGPCKSFGPILQDLAKTQQLNLIKINIDEDSDLASEYNVRGIPTVLFFKNGELKETSTGNIPKSKLISIIEILK